MKKILATIFVAVVPAIFAATNEVTVIPQPQKIEIRSGEFHLTSETKIAFVGGEAEAQFLAAKLRQSTGFKLLASPISTLPGKSEIDFLLDSNLSAKLGDEGYELSVTQQFVTIQAPTPAGLFYGAQTLLQLLPPEIFSTNVVTNVDWQIPCVQIEDRPRFKWRGLMLDVSRHFYDKAEVERILDEMALHKLNVLHWHLTDDQGWRIEIKKYPKLTEVGAWRTASKLKGPRGEVDDSGNAHPDWANVSDSKFNSQKRYGGFYTQDEIREVVKYAAERHITIVPEIEMPGHAVAALAAYPQFGSDTNTYTTDVKAGVNAGVFDPSNPATFQFLDDVLTEVFQLFPGKYVHVGGDEVNAKVKAATWGKSPQCLAIMQREGLTNVNQLQSWFTKQIEKFVSAHGKTLIGWGEIAGDGLTTNAAVMDWQEKSVAVKTATNGNDVVMSPTKFCYLDYYQSTNYATEPHAIGGFMPLEKVYAFEPIPAKLAPEFQSHILGGQCNLWTEYVASIQHVEYMFWPRACALAEATWSSKESRNYDDFMRRLQIHAKRLDEMGVNYRRASVETNSSSN